jgi:hypothetical protein
MSLTKATYSMIQGAPVNVLDFGAVGDGVTDDTAAIQAAINSLSATGGILEGSQKTYCVTTCNLVSNLLVQNFNFITKAGSTDLVSPITIGAYNDTTTKENITIQNVHINGNRQNQTNIGAQEDGGRSGFRILGHVTNLRIINCSASYCATDGIMLYTAIGTGPTWPRFKDITIENCQFNSNRRHGGSGESMLNARFINCVMNDNGTDLNSTSPLNNGNRGARDGLGNLYGNGFDMEGYGIGYYSQDVIFASCQGLSNATDGIKFYSISARTDPGELPSNKLNIDKCWLDSGTAGSDTALTFSSTIANKTLGSLFDEITVTDCKIDGQIIFRACNVVTVNGGDLLGNGTVVGVCDHSSNVTIGYAELNGRVFTNDTSTIQYAFTGDQATYWNTVQATLAPGATLDLGLARVLTQALLTVYSSQGSFPSGGSQTFAATVFLDAGGGAYVNDIRGNGAVSTGATTLQIVTTSTNWALKNNNVGSISFSYCIQQ